MNKIINNLIENANTIILGKDMQIRLSLACLFSRGHLLIEDLPGMGKTTLAHLLAKLMGLQYNRVQFTSDLLPTDLIGVSIYDKESGSFSFHAGAIFTQVILADEINRATPKAQSALLEAMEERQVTIEGESLELPEPFFVIATQNPSYHVGTYPLPESQYDRFMMKIELGYPDRQAERSILTGRDRNIMLQTLPPCMSTEDVIKIQSKIPQVYVSDALLDYLQDIVDFSRNNLGDNPGLSPRGSLALLRCAQAWAFIDGRNAVVPEDIQAILPSVVSHRLRQSGDHQSSNTDSLTKQLLESVSIP
ncbi:MAG: MoxR family ATPase [Gammaproteobacteria bacterium]|nr:MoxR family ATPase [Gammaproteobacteria bacterium]